MHLSNLGFFSYLGNVKDRTAIAWIVAACAFGLGIFTIVLGLRKKDRHAVPDPGAHTVLGVIPDHVVSDTVGLVTWNWPSLESVPNLRFARVVFHLSGRPSFEGFL